MTETTIIHLSDTHLGHDYVVRSLVRGRLYWRTEDEKLLVNLEKAIRKIKPDYIIHTGDVVNKAIPRNFAKAAEQLKTLFGNAGIDVRKQVLIIPGNHDVKIISEDHEFWGRLGGFNAFLKSFFNESDQRARKPNFVVQDVDRKIWFFCLDSTLKEHYQFAEGEVGAGQWEWFANKCENLMRAHSDHERFVKIVAIHHHPHPIRAGGQERFMQLLDAGKAISLFEKYGVNLVLHGHKHFPHILPYHYGDLGNQHYTVVGAGTATCPFLEEQGGEGNSFNVLKLRPLSNVVSIQRWKADNDKEYTPLTPDPVLHSLFRARPEGYRIAQSRAINQIRDDTGTCLITHQRLGLTVDKRDFEMKNVAFGMSGTAPRAELTDFQYDEDNIASVSYEDNTKSLKKGFFVLKRTLRQGSDPLDMWFTYELKNSFCMRRSEFHTFYPQDDSFEENVQVEVVHPCDQLALVIEFPRNYPVKPYVKIVDQNGVSIPSDSPEFSFQPDKLANRFSLIARRPILQVRYSICWQVPDIK